jgi:alanine racemase
VKTNLTILDRYSPRWVEIDIDAILHNLQEIKRLLDPAVQIMAVVKADAYGCGAPAVSQALVEQGVTQLAVTTIDEGIELRERGIECPILVFNPLLESQVRLALDYDLTPTINSTVTAGFLIQATRERSRPTRAHVKVETGMGRNGLFPGEAVALTEKLAAEPYLKVEGIYTHLAAASSSRPKDRRFTLQQFERLLQVTKALNQKGISIPYRHACNSAALLAYPQMHLNLVRPGTLLYGQYPSPSVPQSLRLRDPWHLKARILQVQEFPRGSSIGYGRTFITRRPTRVGVLPVGYVDGFTVEPVLRPRGFIDLLKVVAKNILSCFGVAMGSQRVRVNERYAPVIGKVAMQSCMIDVTGIPGVEPGTLVELTARRTTISRRLPRVYLKTGQPVLLATPDGQEHRLKREVSYEF